MALYPTPSTRAAQQASACGSSNGPCGPADCGPPAGNELDCCPPSFPTHNVCPVEVYVPGCEPSYEQPLNGAVNCDCVPCLDDLAFTDEQKKAVQAILTGILKNISPYAMSCCQIIDPSGHSYPLAPSPASDADGNPLYTYTGSNQAVINELLNDAGTGALDKVGQVIRDQIIANGLGGQAVPASDFQRSFNVCCDVPIQSAFINHGLAPFGAMGVTGVNAAPIGSLSSIEGHERMAKLFCCALDKLYAAPTMEIVDDPNGDGPRDPVDQGDGSTPNTNPV